MKSNQFLDSPSYAINRPARSILIVRVFSRPYRGRSLPDAQFTFRLGEPQFEMWEDRYFEQQKRLSETNKINGLH